MAIIAYQSFNANVKHDHGAGANRFQPYSRAAARAAERRKQRVLRMPHGGGRMNQRFEGPPELVPIESLSAPQPLRSFARHVDTACQTIMRTLLSDKVDIFVLGEIDTSHPDFVNLTSDPTMTSAQHQNDKACQTFSAYHQNGNSIVRLDEGVGYVVYSVYDMNVVFVHVPNAIAKDAGKTRLFYKGISQSQLLQGKTIDLVIGDTNQSRIDFTADALNAAFSTNVYTNAADAPQAMADEYEGKAIGTNSTGTMMYDVAVYRSDVVDMTGKPCYISPSSGGITVTDHSGLAVEIERK